MCKWNSGVNAAKGMDGGRGPINKLVQFVCKLCARDNPASGGVMPLCVPPVQESVWRPDEWALHVAMLWARSVESSLAESIH